MLRAPGVVLINPKFPHNVGATIRACSCFGSNRWFGPDSVSTRQNIGVFPAKSE
jgi:hypothetical protein